MKEKEVKNPFLIYYQRVGCKPNNSDQFTLITFYELDWVI